MAAHLPEREPSALLVSLSAKTACPCPALPHQTAVELLQKVWLCGQACLGQGAMQTKVLGVEGNVRLSWSTVPTSRSWTEPGALPGSERLRAAPPSCTLSCGSGSSLFPKAPHWRGLKAWAGLTWRDWDGLGKITCLP